MQALSRSRIVGGLCNQHPQLNLFSLLPYTHIHAQQDSFTTLHPTFLKEKAIAKGDFDSYQLFPF